MKVDEYYIPDEEWEVIVENVPIVSVDLVVLFEEGVVLGKRQNEPAKGEWFVPGGRVRKHESLTDSVHRVADEELNTDIEIKESLGVYEHFYETSEIEDVDGKHYLANGFIVKITSDEFESDNQHEDFQVFNDFPPNLHKYVKAYLNDANLVS